MSKRKESAVMAEVYHAALRLSRRYTQKFPETDPEDLAQLTVEKVLPVYRSGRIAAGKEQQYAYRVCTNLALSRLRRDRVARFSSLNALQEDTGFEPARTVHVMGLSHKVMQIARQVADAAERGDLGPYWKKRDVVEAIHQLVQGGTAEDVATALNVKPNSYLRAAVAGLRRHLLGRVVAGL